MTDATVFELAGELAEREEEVGVEGVLAVIGIAAGGKGRITTTEEDQVAGEGACGVGASVGHDAG